MFAAAAERKVQAEVRVARDEARLEVEALRAKVTGLEPELAAAHKEAAAARSEMEYCRLVGQVHEGVSKSAGKLAEKLSDEKRLLEKKVKRLVVGKVLNGRDKGTQMLAPPGSPVCVGFGVQTESVAVSVVGM